MSFTQKYQKFQKVDWSNDGKFEEDSGISVKIGYVISLVIFSGFIYVIWLGLNW